MTEPAWLLLTTSTTGAKASLRVTIWRRLRGLGALYLQSSVCVLPDRPGIRAAVDQLRERVLGEGGVMRVLPIQVLSEPDQADLIGELNAARDGEYAEVLERLPALLGELQYEKRRGRLTFEEVEESEVDLARFVAWVERIGSRDYFGAALRGRVDDELAGAARALADFEACAVRAQTDNAEADSAHTDSVQADSVQGGRRLQRVPMRAVGGQP